jgi:hypothetical protein
VEPQPKEGQLLPEIAGVLQYSWNRNKLLPRGPDDLNLGDPTLLGLDSGVGKVYAGQTIAILTASLSHASKSPLNLKLSSSDPNIATVSNAVIPADVTEISVAVTGVVAGTTTITGTLGESSLKASITVLEADFKPSVVSLEPLSAVVTLGGSIVLTVHIDNPAPPAGLIVGITSEGVPANHPSSVTVEEGTVDATFKVNQFVSTGFVTIVAASGGTSKSSTLDVQDAILYGMLLVEIHYDSKGSDDKKEWVKLYNGTGTEVDLSQFGIGYGGTDYTYGVYQPLGSIPAGMCALVGGPASNPDNGDPLYDLPKDFDPDIQNSGDTADGIALFDMPAELITKESVPIDAVVYGGQNKSALLGVDGIPVAAPDVGDVSGGKSIKRISYHEWGEEESPNSTECIVIK